MELTVYSASWCRDCPKCRFVFLILAPFLSPEAMTGIGTRWLTSRVIHRS